MHKAYRITELIGCIFPPLFWGGLAIVLFLSAPHLFAVPGDEHWDRSFGVPGTSNLVFAIEIHDGKIYTSGVLPGAPTSTNVLIEIYDGDNWQQIHGLTGSPS